MLEHGFGGADNKYDFTNVPRQEGGNGIYKDKNGVSTGVTWIDLWDYFDFLQLAYNRAK